MTFTFCIASAKGHLLSLDYVFSNIGLNKLLAFTLLMGSDRVLKISYLLTT